MARVFLTLLTLAWWSLVFVSSGEGASGSWTKRLLAELLGLSGNTLEWANLLMRKTGHIAYYFVLTVLFAKTLSRFLVLRTSQIAWIAVGMAFATGVFDEVRQSFIPARTGTVADLLYDLAGISLAMLYFFKTTSQAAR